MIDNLDSIDWSKITHAYGPATEIPATLRALATGDKKQREDALWELHGNIWHQGTVYEASAFAVPFLLELVRNKHADSLQILYLLALIADGHSYLSAHRWPPTLTDQEYQERLGRERKWIANSKAAVGKGRDLFLALVGGDDRRLSVIGALLLGLTSQTDEDEIDTVNVIEKIDDLKS